MCTVAFTNPRPGQRYSLSRVRRGGGRLLGVAVLALTVSLAHAQGVPSESTVERQPAQPNDCVTKAAEYHSVNPWVLRAIIKVESNFNTNAVNRNRNGTVDVGIAQINSMHFKELGKHGVGPADLMNGCIASYVAAWHLKKQIKAYGNTWFAIGAYHSATPCYNSRYSALIWNTLVGWKVFPGSRLGVPSMASCAGSSSARNTTTSSVLAFENN